VTSLKEIGEEEMADTTDLKVCEHVSLFLLNLVVLRFNFLRALRHSVFGAFLRVVCALFSLGGLESWKKVA
jgi:hypothetical protein